MSSIDQKLVLIFQQGGGKDGVEILLKLLNNFLSAPNNPKFRSIKLDNKVIKEKLLSIPTMKELLLEIGFIERNGTLNLSPTILLNTIRRSRDIIQSQYDSFKQREESELSIKPSTSSTTGAKRKLRRHFFDGKVVPINIFTNSELQSNPFFLEMEKLTNQALSYESEELLKYGRLCVPLEKLKANALDTMRILQKAIKSGKSSTMEDPVFEDVFLREFTSWFNESFFKWVNKIACKVCGKDVAKHSIYVENGIRVEEIFCCNKPTKFYRYNDIPTLLVTRQGRCGEYANCFTFLCRALGYEARFVMATFDHVWTEVYSPFQTRWLHVDPSDNVVDSPLMYQHGWKRTVDYVMAYSKDNIQDVTWRYSNDHCAILQRRTRVPEDSLVKKIIEIRNKLQENCSKTRKDYLNRRDLAELVQLMVEKQPTTDELRGRSSGDVEWRKNRGEQESNAFYVFKASDEDVARRQLNIRYSCAADRYDKFIKDQSNVIVTETSRSWESWHFSSKNIFRKEENDWKMVYLARTEDTSVGSIEWKFDFTDRNLSVKTITTTCETKMYENAVIKLNYFRLDGQELPDVAYLKNSSGFVIRASLSGGIGDNAWQHSQLFRQEMNSDKFPFEICITFH